MKEFILKNKKVSCIILVALAILFAVLAILNLTGTKREAYQSMYDANKTMYDTYIDVADKYSEYGYSAKAQNYYYKAQSEKDDMDKYQDELSSLNIELLAYGILTVASIVVLVLVLKTSKTNTTEQMAENTTLSTEEV